MSNEQLAREIAELMKQVEVLPIDGAIAFGLAFSKNLGVRANKELTARVVRELPLHLCGAFFDGAEEDEASK